MLLSLTDLISRYELKITGVLHVGAHLAEEAPEYEKLGVNKVIWVEANSDNIPEIKRNAEPYGHYVIEALITDKVGDDITFNITNHQSMSSSIFEFGTHTTFSPDTIFVEHRSLKSTTLDALSKLHHSSMFSGINMLNMDIQGAELLALRGAKNLLPQIDYIYTEVNQAEVYVGCAQVNEMDAYLVEFERVETGWVPRQGWGDALYIRKDKR